VEVCQYEAPCGFTQEVHDELCDAKNKNKRAYLEKSCNITWQNTKHGYRVREMVVHTTSHIPVDWLVPSSLHELEQDGAKCPDETATATSSISTGHKRQRAAGNADQALRDIMVGASLSK
jgi:hypothetical protein